MGKSNKKNNLHTVFFSFIVNIEYCKLQFVPPSAVTAPIKKMSSVQLAVAHS